MNNTDVWVEITESAHKHGGKGWEFGTCLWSPSRDRAGTDKYEIMRRPSVGDIVLHFYKDKWPDGRLERRVSGHSRVKKGYREIYEEPPSPGIWANMKRYYRIDLEDYHPLTKPLPVRELEETYGNEIRREILEIAPRFYPFTKYGDTIRTVRGRYLARCTDNLYLLIKTIAKLEEGINESRRGIDSPHSEYSEALRYSKEKYFWARNRELAREAKKYYGFRCQICESTYEEIYGNLGKSYIECHHLNPLSERAEREWTKEIRTNIKDVTILCANCHRIVHSRKRALSIDFVKAHIRKG